MVVSVRVRWSVLLLRVELVAVITATVIALYDRFMVRGNPKGKENIFLYSDQTVHSY